MIILLIFRSNIVIEKHIDILSLPPEYSLACCVATDFYKSDVTNAFKYEMIVLFLNSKTISINIYFFRNKFGQMGVLMDQCLQWGDVGEILSDENQYVFYLVLKKKIGPGSTLNSFEKTLHSLLWKMNKYGLTKLAISKSGLERFTLSEAKQYISKVFAKSNIEVTLCLNPLVSFYYLVLF